jgi:hypothetical protein
MAYDTYLHETQAQVAAPPTARLDGLGEKLNARHLPSVLPVGLIGVCHIEEVGLIGVSNVWHRSSGFKIHRCIGMGVGFTLTSLPLFAARRGRS